MADDDKATEKNTPKTKQGGFRKKFGATNGSPTSIASLNSDTAVPMLRLGVSNNFDTFRKKVSIACLEKYKNLGRLVHDEAYYVPAPVNPKDFDLANDPHDIEKTRLREAHKRRDKEVDDMRVDRTSMYAYLLSKLSKESLEKTWATIECSRDPLALWMVIKSTHQILTTSKVASVIKKTAREEYSACRQGAFEHIVDYKRKFDARLDALTVSGNAVPPGEDIAMDFMYGLDNNRYAEFKAEIVNDLQKGTLTTQIADLNKMYILASRRVVVKDSKTSPGGATFATLDGQRRLGKNQKNPNDESASSEGKNKMAEQRYQEKLAKMKCYNCGEKGHVAKNCPHLSKSDGEEEEPPLAGLTLACCAAGPTDKNRLFAFYEVCLDSGSQINIVDPRLLNNLRTSNKTFRSMNGVSKIDRVGHLDGFFECHACEDCPANILSMADVEDKFAITWEPGESMIVHLEERDIVFKRRDKMWVGDFLDWIVSDEERLVEMQAELSLLTVKEKEDLYTMREVRKALEAGGFLKPMGYPSRKEALGIVRDGNVNNIPYTAADINRFYDIYGPQVPGVRGKTMKKRAKAASELDRGAQLQIKSQEMSIDVMHTAGYKSLVSVCKPLGLTLIDTLKSLSKNELGRSLQAHVNTLRSKGFDPTHVYADPQRGFGALQGSFPGVSIDVSGASDQLAVVDTKIRRIKEIMRAVLSGLPYRLHKDRIKDLATFAVSRTNLKSTAGLVSNKSPRVRFTGVKPEYKSEFGLAFGDYVEAYNPRAEGRSNDVTMPRTEPCIALYPSANRNGSWILWNLHTKSYVRRTQWKKLPVSDTVIGIMNDLAGAAGIKTADIPIEGYEQELDNETSLLEQLIVRQHTEEEGIVPTEPENEINDVEMGMPELTAHSEQDDDSDSESEDDDDLDNESEEDDDVEGLAAGDGLDEEALEVQERLMEEHSDSSSAVQTEVQIPLQRTSRQTAGHKRYDENYEWNLLNLSVGAAIRNFGNVAREAVSAELVQLFKEKKALTPVKIQDLTESQRKNIIRSHMFVTEKYEDGKFVKMKGQVVADRRMHDHNVYSDYSSPTAKTRSVMTCLKIAAVKGWDLLKLDVGGAFLCAPIGDSEEVFMVLDKNLAERAVDSMPDLKEFIGADGKLVVRVDKAMYGLIQSAKLWYNELNGFLMSQGFRKCILDECILVKRMPNGESITVVLYVDDILVMGKIKDDRHWVKSVLEDRYKKITSEEGQKFTYLGMTIVRKQDGFQVCMRAYIEDILKLYGKTVKACVTPAKPGLFVVNANEQKVDSVIFIRL
jgi:hypothetical protein